MILTSVTTVDDSYPSVATNSIHTLNQSQEFMQKTI